MFNNTVVVSLLSLSNVKKNHINVFAVLSLSDFLFKKITSVLGTTSWLKMTTLVVNWPHELIYTMLLHNSGLSGD